MGVAPTNRLLLRVKDNKLDKLVRGGIEPTREFPEAERVVNLTRDWSAMGRFPCRQFWSMARYDRSVNEPNVDGIFPTKELNAKFKEDNFAREPREGGMVPDNLQL